MAYRRVAALADIPQGRGLRVCVGSLEIGLFRVEDAVYALENPCPHRESPLSDGELNGCVITCPAHGWEFDVRTGFRPEDPDGWPIPRFAVRVAAGEVWLDPEDVINRRPRARRG